MTLLVLFIIFSILIYQVIWQLKCQTLWSQIVFILFLLSIRLRQWLPFWQSFFNFLHLFVNLISPWLLLIFSQIIRVLPLFFLLLPLLLFLLIIIKSIKFKPTNLAILLHLRYRQYKAIARAILQRFFTRLPHYRCIIQPICFWYIKLIFVILILHKLSKYPPTSAVISSQCSNKSKNARVYKNESIFENLCHHFIWILMNPF